MKRADAAFKKPLDRSEIMTCVAEATGLTTEQVAGVIEELGNLIRKNLEQEPGEITVPGLFLLRVVRTAATEVRVKFDPATKRQTQFNCDSFRHRIKLVPSKSLRDSVEFGWQ